MRSATAGRMARDSGSPRTAAIGLGHRRLAIVDLSPLGLQPMATPDGRLRVVYNGEIYNFPKLRAELEGLGHRFASTSDTEVLLHGYREWGLRSARAPARDVRVRAPRCRAGETLLARDPLGIKPLYVADDGKRLVFASEVRAIRRVSDGGGLDPEGLATYLLWGSIAPPRTLHRADPRASRRSVAPRRARAESRVRGATSRLEDELGHSRADERRGGGGPVARGAGRFGAAPPDGGRAGRVVPLRRRGFVGARRPARGGPRRARSAP